MTDHRTRVTDSYGSALAAAFAILLSVACGGERGDRPAAERGAGDAGTLTADQVTPQMIALGNDVYHGRVGVASCQSCHGENGQGTSIGPNLTDGEWLHSDGSLQGIITTIRNGVMSPKEFTSVMPPYGGIPLPPEHTRAVAAYVHSLGGGR